MCNATAPGAVVPCEENGICLSLYMAFRLSAAARCSKEAALCDGARAVIEK